MSPGAQELRGALDAAEGIADLVRQAERRRCRARRAGRRAAWWLSSARSRVRSWRTSTAPRSTPCSSWIGRARGADDDLLVRGRAGDPRCGGGRALRGASRCASSASHALVGRPSTSCSTAQPDALRGGDTGQLLGRRVEIVEDAVGVEDDHAVGDAGEDVGPGEADRSARGGPRAPRERGVPTWLVVVLRRPASASSPPPASSSSTISSKSSPASSPSSLPILRIQRATLFGSLSSSRRRRLPRSSSRASSERTMAKRDMRRDQIAAPAVLAGGVDTSSETRRVSTVTFRRHAAQRYS